MSEEVADLEQQVETDASASSEEEVQGALRGRDPHTGRFIPADYVDDSIDTAPAIPVEAEAEEVEVVEEPESEVESSPTDVEAVDENAEDDPDYGVKTQTRIDELVGNYRGEQRINEELRSELAKANEALAAIPEQREPLKTFEDFAFDSEKYSAYIRDEAKKDTETLVRSILREHDADRGAQNGATEFRKAEGKFAEQHTDYNQKVYGEVDGLRGWQATDVMAREIRMTENGHELAYHLANNPDIADKLARMPERQAVLAMDKIHRTLEAGKAEVRAAKGKTSKAPPPTPKVKGGDAGPKPTGYHDGMSDAQFDAMRRKEIANR